MQAMREMLCDLDVDAWDRMSESERNVWLAEYLPK